MGVDGGVGWGCTRSSLALRARREPSTCATPTHMAVIDMLGFCVGLRTSKTGVGHGSAEGAFWARRAREQRTHGATRLPITNEKKPRLSGA